MVHDVTFSAQPGQVIGIIGPNGSGKSSLPRAIIGILRPTTGTVRVDGRDVLSTKPRDLARVLAAVLQDSTGDFDLTVHDVVTMGRACHKRSFERETTADRKAITEALTLVGAADLTHRRFADLSGGERQRVLIARAIAQQPRVLVMDEPTNHLDPRHQFDVLALPRTLDVTALVALHDLNLAARYCDQIHLLHHGRQHRSGPPEHVLDPEILRTVYDVNATVTPHPTTGRPHIALDPCDNVVTPEESSPTSRAPG
ncbi:ABC transporter ATP-binding protein [Actinokineospora sp. HUAS TT18]|uniref:ABC transporter ATP-binding protein n=1 Tax=Actinokineospora sp. HUAS TT18 TaxID=3447451 RepID=UPI003F5253B2